MAWLSGWAKRIEITIDHDDIDSELTHFPVLIYLSAASGVEDDDVSCVFDELTSDDNRKKIAVTKSDGTTQLYVEIEKWDDANEKAWLWVSKSDWVVSNSEDTVIYLYYDSEHADNDTYVGDTNSEVAENVWDSNFAAVHHMADGADNQHIYDSTSNDNDGTKGAAGAPNEVAAQIGKGQNYDGDERVVISNHASLNTDYATWEAWVYWDGSANIKYIFDHGYTSKFLLYSGTGNHKAYVKTSAGTANPVLTDAMSTLEWHHIVITYDGSYARIYLDGSEAGTPISNSGTLLSEGADDFYIGSYQGGGDTYCWNGDIDEVRVSSIARLVAWIKATYETGRDDLLDFGSEEEAPTDWLSGWAKRVKLTIDHDDIDATLTWFPVLIHLGASVGRNSDDVSCVFDELTQDANEKWDDANEQAWLWVSKSDWEIDPDTDTDIYLYYDSTHADNDSYIGDTNDEVAENVWGTDFVGVYHMRDGADTSNIYDSTSNDNDGAKAGAGTPAEAEGKIAEAQLFDAGDDYINMGQPASLDIDDESISLQCWFKPSSFPGGTDRTHIQNKSGAYALQVVGNGQVRCWFGSTPTSSTTTEVVLSADTWALISATYDGSKVRIYINGELEEEFNLSGNQKTSVTDFFIGGEADAAQGVVDEFIVSDGVLPPAWLKATYETGRDDLLDFGSEEIAPSGGVPKHMNYYRRMRIL